MTTTTDPKPARVAESEQIRLVLTRSGGHERRARPIKASLTYAWRALLKIKHIPEQLFDVTIFPIMMTVLFTYIFGGALAGSVDQYVQWLIPGIFVQTLIMITITPGSARTGTSPRAPSTGSAHCRPGARHNSSALLGDQVRYLLAGMIILGVGFPWASVPSEACRAQRPPCSCCWSPASASPGSER